MHRLIVQLKEPLNASFCEAVVNLFGQCELIPMTEDYCVVEGVEIEEFDACLGSLLELRRSFMLKAFLANLHGDFEDQTILLQECQNDTMICDYNPKIPTSYKSSLTAENTWLIIGI